MKTTELQPRTFPVSCAQQRFWFLDRLDPGTSAYNVTRAIRVVGLLDATALAQALKMIVQRHASLRTRFAFGTDAGYQIVDDAIKFQLPLLDISSLPDADREREALRLARHEAHRGFDLTSGPLFRFALIRLDCSDHVLVLVMHHIITDGWSMRIMFDELGKLYDEQTRGEPATLPPLCIQYSDFTQWQHENLTSEALHADLVYWTDKLKEHSGFINWPADRPRPHIQSHKGATETFYINNVLAEDLSALAKRCGATLFMVLLAALQTLVWRYTSTDDILIGVPFTGRNHIHLENVIGCFVNTVVIRGDLSGNPTFVSLLEHTRQSTLEAYEHQHFPFEKLVEALRPERSLTVTPLFQIMFVFHNDSRQMLKLPGLTLEELEFDAGSAKFDLTFEVVEQNGLHCNIEYRTDLFDKESIQRLARHYENLLGDITRNSHLPISQLQLLDETERQKLIVSFNSTEALYHRDARIERMFEEQAGRTPNQIAFVEGETEISYHDLSARADALARVLVSEGCDQNRPVGVYMERSVDAVVAFLAALKANAPYVPLDISNPPHRLDLLIRDAGCGVILTHRGHDRALPNDVQTIPVDQPIAMRGDPPDLPADGTPDDLAYVIYTSGSTGVPKGVEGSHRAAINRFEWMWRTFPFLLEETCCQKTALGFVDSVWEIFGPLLGGVRVVIIPDDLIFDLDQFVSLLSRHKVTRIVLVPSFLRTLLDVVPDLATRLQDLKLWSVSGEILSVDLARRFRELLPAARLLNIYGSSEVTADVTYWELGHTDGLVTVPIGRPISNTQIFILDKHKNLVPPLVHGEIHVGGDCLARGYWKQPELTSQRFLPNIYRPERSRLLFATGDLGRILTDGTIEYLGRLDNQIQLRGIRIEPGEIEANLTAHPLVRKAVVLVHGDSCGAQHLTAYVVRSEGTPSLIDELRSFLRERVPEYMIPAVFVELDRMPLLPSGKINRAALPNPTLEPIAKRRAHIGGRTEIEKNLISIWQEVLELDQVSVEDNFFDLGGHSLDGMRVLARVARDFHVDVPIRTLFNSPTIAELALSVERQKAAGALSKIASIAPTAEDSSALLNSLRAQLLRLPPAEIDAFLHSVLAEKKLSE